MSSDEAKPELPNKFFLAFFTREQLSDIPALEVDTVPPLPELSDIEVSPELVEQKLHTLNPVTTPGPDDIHPRVARDASLTLLTSVSLTPETT